VTSPPADPGWRLVVLGTAQDGGMPHPGCAAGPCAAARRGERPAARVACLGLTDGRRGFLLDATPDLPAQAAALGFPLPDGIFLTHAHVGHYLGLAWLGKEAAAARGIPVHATGRMRAFLAANAPWSALVEGGHVDLRDNAAVDLGGLRVTAIPVPHRQEFADTVGYRIEGPRGRALFVPDIDRWEDWDRDLRAEVEGVDVAFLDATFFSGAELPGRDMARVPHPLVTDTMERLEGLGGKVRLLHLNHSNPLWEDDGPVRARGFAVAREGESFPL
jgi:pyrroloquinoline quinone biosynthesis protein B